MRRPLPLFLILTVLWLAATPARSTATNGPLLPLEAGTGIVINLAEFRLFLIEESSGQLRATTYPVGIGNPGWETPEGHFEITHQIINPTWAVPPSIRAQRPELPLAVPPGPKNPLGEFWLGLSARGYGIHGTRDRSGVGRRVSHGCLRLYPEDIRELFFRVKIGTPVHIVYQPIKLGRSNGQLYLEAHPDYLGRFTDPRGEVTRQLRLLGEPAPRDWTAIMTIIRAGQGRPMVIGSTEH